MEEICTAKIKCSYERVVGFINKEEGAWVHCYR